MSKRMEQLSHSALPMVSETKEGNPAGESYSRGFVWQVGVGGGEPWVTGDVYEASHSEVTTAEVFQDAQQLKQN